MKMKKMVILASMLFTSIAFAQVDKNIQDTITKSVKENFNQVKTVNSITQTQLPGVYEVIVDDTNILYIDGKGQYGFDGNIVDIKNKKSLTQERVDKLTALDYNKDLDFKNSFKIVKGDGSRKFTVFADPNCSFCKQFEKELEKVNNYTMNVFLLPVLGNDSMKKSQSIWCAENREKVWTDWMLNGKEIPEKTCANPLEKNLETGKKFKIRGTPTIVFPDGVKNVGMMRAEQLEERLNKK